MSEGAGPVLDGSDALVILIFRLVEGVQSVGRESRLEIGKSMWMWMD